MTETTGCHAAVTGEGYWTCDVPGGCADCRALAREINDTDQIARWKEETPMKPPTFEFGEKVRVRFSNEVAVVTHAEGDDYRLDLWPDQIVHSKMLAKITPKEG